MFRVCHAFPSVCSLRPCSHLLGKGRPLGSLVCDVYRVFVTFQYGVLGRVWCLIVWIPDIYLLFYFKIYNFSFHVLVV